MIKIGDFSKLSMISIRMLRHYDSIGLLIPEQIDRFTGYRYYSARQLSTASRIQALKQMGFGLAAIKEILSAYGDADSLRQYLLIHRKKIQNDAKQLEQQMRLVEKEIDRLRKDGNFMKYDVTIKEFPKLQMACLRDVIPSYEREGILWERMKKAADKIGVQPANPCYSMAVFYDEGFKESDVDVEIRMAVTGVYQDAEDLKFRDVPQITVATAILKGDFSGVSDACQSIADWVTSNGYRFNGPMFNIYHVNPGTDPNPENWVTEICFPVAK